MCIGLQVLEVLCITEFNQEGYYLWQNFKNSVKYIYVFYDLTLWSYFFQSHCVWGEGEGASLKIWLT